MEHEENTGISTGYHCSGPLARVVVRANSSVIVSLRNMFNSSNGKFV